MIETYTVEIHPLVIKEWELYLEVNSKYITVVEKDSDANLYSKIKSLEQDIEDLEKELNDAKDEINDLENELYSYEDKKDADKLERIKAILDE